MNADAVKPVRETVRNGSSDRAAGQGREYGLDWLRVIAFAILIFYHCGMLFVTWPWHIQNEEKSRGLELVMLFFNRWRLPLLFFISGAGVYFSLRHRTFPRFAGERVVRLFVPLAFGMLVVVPPQIFVERVHKGAHYASYFDFWQTVFAFHSYPQGSLSWHHLWFVAYIFVYSILGIPVFAFLLSDTGRQMIGAFTRMVETSRPAIYLVNIPSLVISLTLGARWPTTHALIGDWANLSSCFVTFLWGFILASDKRLLDLITSRRKEFLIFGALTASAFYAIVLSGTRRQLPPLVWETINSYFGMAAIFVLVGYARAKLHHTSGFLRYATEAVYPFYILHQTVIICIGYFLIRWPAPVPAKLAIAMCGTFVVTLLLFEIIRRVSPLRPLFGLRLTCPAPLQ